jgi:RHS repeat-associated protein
VYDRFGNRLQQTNYTGTCMTPNYTLQTGKYWISGFSYDLAGDMIGDGIHSYQYDAEGRLASVDSGSTATYVYDAGGTRVRRITGGLTYDDVHDLGGRVISDFIVTGSTGTWNRGEVYAGGMHLATYIPSMGNTYFVHGDWLGTERVRSTAGGAIYSTWTSYPFGEGSATPNPSPAHFTGKERDSESGNDYFGARYYSSSMGRFMSPDWSAQEEPVPYAKLDNPQSLNLYSYMLNNPLSGVDPDGHAGTCGGSDGSTCKVTMTQISQNMNFYDKQGNVLSTVNVTTNMTTISNSVSGAVVSANASATATNVSGTAFSDKQLGTIGSTIGAVQQAGASMSLGSDSAHLLTAITEKETSLGLGPSRNAANPLQLSCSSGNCPNGDRGHNIQGALNVLQHVGNRTGFDPASTYGRYNGVGGRQGVTNVNNFMQMYNGMSQSSWGWSPSVPAAPIPAGLQ